MSDGASKFETCTTACLGGIAGAGAGELQSPSDIAIGSSGDVYLVAPPNNRVDEFSPTGSFIRAWGWGVSDGGSQFETCTTICQAGTVGGGAGEFAAPSSIATDDSGNVFVAEDQRIDEFSSSGSFIQGWGWGVSDGASKLETCTITCQAGTAGAGAGQLDFPAGISTDSSGNVYVPENGSQRIDEFSSTGSFIKGWGWGVSDGASKLETCTATCQAGTAGPGAGQLDFPVSTATDSSGNVYVADYDNARIDEFSSSGSFIRAWGWGVSDGASKLESCTTTCQAGSTGGGAGQLDGLGDITIDGSAHAYVADISNNRVDEFSSSGSFIRAWGWGVSDGQSKFETCTTTCQAGINGAGSGQLDSPDGIAIDSAGDAYVADYNNDRIAEFTTAQTTIAVNTQADLPATGTFCAGGSSSCSLRQAVAKAGPGSTITLPAGTYKLNPANGPIAITQDLTIVGTGLPIIDGLGHTQVFSVSGAPSVTISDVEVTGGSSVNGSAIGTDGGALTLSGDSFTGNVSGTTSFGNGSVYANASAATSLTITGSRFSGEHVGAKGGGGEGVVNVATTSGNLTVHITGSSFNGNFIGGGGSGGSGFGTLWVSPAVSGATNRVTIDSSQFNHNTLGGAGSSGFGGGVSIESGTGTLTIANSQFNSNHLGAGGGSGFGGGLDIESDWNVNIARSTFDDNILGGTASNGGGNGDGFGGGISLQGSTETLTVTDSSFQGNTVGGTGGAGTKSGSGFGGGISIEAAGDTTIKGSTFSANVVGGNGGVGKNSATGYGGAISDEGGGTATGGLAITNSTLTGNRAGGAAGSGPGSGTGVGGAIDGEISQGAIRLTDDTIDANSAGGAGAEGGALYAAGNPTDVYNSILAGNTRGGSGNDCFAPVTLSDHSDESGSTSCGFTQPGDSSKDPLLAPLANNGGPAETQLLELTPQRSPAIDAGDPARCPAIDQRGSPRPDIAGTACDMGAVETPTPVVGRSVSSGQVTGTVLIKLPGTQRFVSLSPGERVPLGSTLDATNGKISLLSAEKQGVTNLGTFYGTVFRLSGKKLKGRELTILTLQGPRFKLCLKTQATDARHRPRRLWGSSSGGFGTAGSYASATERGTKWLTQDSCSGTLIRVTSGVVSVRDFPHRRTLTLRAGHSFLAHPGQGG